MAIKFPGLTFPGVHGPVLHNAPALQTVRTKFPGVLGESEIRLGRGGRTIEIDLRLASSSYTTAAAVDSQLRKYAKAVGTHGVLEITGNLKHSFPNCTFEGATQLEDILPDPAGTLTGTANVYHTAIRLRWYQLFDGA